jgi:ABC-type Fe3+ transport system substrate-binding protein
VVLVASLAEAQDQLILLSPHWEGVRAEFGDGFKKSYQEETGREVDLKWLDVGGTSDILKFIRSEFKNKSGGIGVDLLFGGGTDPFMELKKLGFLESYRAADETLSELVPHIGGVPLYDPDFTWYAATMAGFGIVYNKVILKRLGLPEPRTWEDLARPEVFSWVGSADPRKSGSVHMAYEIILQAYGWEPGWRIIVAMGANVRGFSGYASQTPKDVTLGEVAYGLSIDSYAWSQVREVGEEMIGYAMPEDLTVVNGDGIALLKGAPHREVAVRFIEFVLSEKGQKLWILRQGEPDGPQRYELGKFSVRPGLYPKVQGRTPVQLNPFTWRSDFAYDAEKGGRRWGLVNDLMGAMIIEPQGQLAAAWERAIEAGETQAALDRLGAMPLSEVEAEELLAEGRWQEAEFRNRTLNEWATLARERYGSGAEGGRILRHLPVLLALVLGTGMFAYLRRRRGF